jgi:hypothetical protein
MVYAYELVFFYEDSYLHFDVFFLLKGFVPGVLTVSNMAAKMRKWRMMIIFLQYDKSP